jgi:hypothetical protein
MSPVAQVDSTESPPRSRRVWAIVVGAGIVVLITLAAAFVIEGLDWFSPQGWALRALAVLGLVALPRLGRMGRVGAVLLAVGVAVFTAVEVTLAVAPEVGSSGALSGVTVPVFVMAASGYFILTFGALRSLQLPWWATAAVAATAVGVWGIGMLATIGNYTDELAAQHIVAQNYLFAVAVVSVIAAIIDGVRHLRARKRP